MSPHAAERFLEHMENSLEELEADEVTLQDKEKLQDFMRYTAYYLVAAQQTQTAHGAEGIHFLN
ncbi:hypothetical protein B484DRAFT_404584 [Ochromonadaceae sp. CCMP2298]|nr:hypothetical protein B484DRAFT_404584 [Ochromonadaceae sp. CCMP2298]